MSHGVMDALRGAWGLVRAHWRAYVGVNVLYYGVVVFGMLLGGVVPSLAGSLWDAAQEGLKHGMLAVVAWAYKGGYFPLAVVLTFAVNLLLGTILALATPSLVVPFLGLVVGLGRALMWGLLFTPFSHHFKAGMIPHMGTLLLEGQGYVLAMLAVWLHGIAWVLPGSEGLRTHGQGYERGIRTSLRLYPLVMAVLAVAAAYEAFEVIYIVPKI